MRFNYLKVKDMMEADLYKFRLDLKDGYTIEEALHRNNLSFKYVLENMPRPHCKDNNKHRRKQ